MEDSTHHHLARYTVATDTLKATYAGNYAELVRKLGDKVLFK